MTRAPPPAALVRYAKEADPLLRDFLARKGSDLRGLPLDLAPVHDAITDYVLRGGKRMRGALVLLGCEAAGSDPGSVRSASIALELLHAYLLIHDDFMDGDELRRGGPTLHIALGKKSPHLGDSLAVLAGSLCESWALELLLDSPVDTHRTVAAAKLLSSALQQVILGQSLDLCAPFEAPLDDRGVARLQELKTGSYTFELPLHIGAVLGGATDEVLRTLLGFARPLGVAFQIADDLLGTFGSPEVTGKPSGADVREGKRTLLVARALRMAGPEDAAFLRETLGRRDLSEPDVEAVRAVLERSGAAASCREEAEHLLSSALSALEGSQVPPSVQRTLREIGEYTVRRSS
ncbi:MAG: polyprenyl synthetase family protein [Myxococcales bacterium]